MMHYLFIELLTMCGPALFFGIGLGPSKQEKNEFGAMGNLANFATSSGESDISTADNFWKSILSGDPSKISQVLGPQTSAINKQAQEQKKTASEFGTRSGGTNAAQQMAGDQVRTTYDTMVSGLTGQAAGALGASGSSLLAAGLSGHEAAFSEADTLHQQSMAKLNDIFKSIAETAGAVFAPGAGAAAGGAAAGASAISAVGEAQPVLDTSYAGMTL
jgi:hypothetical protein